MKKPNEVTAGKSCADYGGHELALNFPYQQIDSSGKMNNVKVGSATIGLMYDGDWKTAANDGRTRCLVSQKNLDYLTAVKSSLEFGSLLPPQLTAPLRETMRLNLLRGAQTLWHTDAFKGATNNYLKIDDDGKSGDGVGFLTVDESISFRCSVVMYNDRLYLPVSYSEATKTLRMVGFGVRTEPSYEALEECADHATFYLFDSKVFNELTPYGNLPFAFVGLLQGKLQVVDLDEELKLFESPLKFATINFKACLALARQSPVQTPKRYRYRYLEARGNSYFVM
jgi:hypothetical protein